MGMLRSFSRPRVSNDTPYSESLFSRAKNRPDYPRRPFASEDEAKYLIYSKFNKEGTKYDRNCSSIKARGWKELKILKNIGITASASSPEILVSKLLNNLKNSFDLKINEAHYQKEDTYFKVPQILKV